MQKLVGSRRSLGGLAVGEETTWIHVSVVGVHAVHWLLQNGPMELVQRWSNDRLAHFTQNFALDHVRFDGA